MLILVKSSASLGYRPPVYSEFQQRVMHYWNTERIVVLQSLLERIEQQPGRPGFDRDALTTLAEQTIMRLAAARHSPFAVAAELQEFLRDHDLI